MTPINGAHLNVKAPEVAHITATVTPATASKWLATQVRNRPVQTKTMVGYLSDMKAGRWSFAGDPIRFDFNGHLIDGQNRLTALAQMDDPDFSLDFLVIVGLDPETQMVMDQGAKRTAGQQLNLLGHSNGSNIAAGVRMLISWERKTLVSMARISGPVLTNAQIIEWADAHPDLIELAASSLARIRSIGIRPNAGLAFVMRIGPKLKAETDEFLREMFELTNLPEGSPTLALAKRIQRSRDIPDFRMSDLDHLGLLIVTWNHWVAGNKISKLQRPRGGWTMDNFPELDI